MFKIMSVHCYVIFLELTKFTLRVNQNRERNLFAANFKAISLCKILFSFNEAAPEI